MASKQHRKGGKKKVKGGRSRRGMAQFTLGETASYLRDFWGYAKAGLTLLNTEIKMYDYFLTGAVSNTGGVTYLSAIAQGNDWNNRQGNSVRLVGVEMSYIGTLIAGVSSARVLLFADNESRGAAPTTADLLEAGGGAYGCVSPYEHKSINRFNVMRDDLLTWGPGNSASSVTHAKHYVLPTSSHIMWNGTGSGIADSGEGAIFICYMSDQAAAGSFNLQLMVRFFYVDN